MANKVKIDYSQFKASGVYTLEFDASQSVILTSQTIRLVVGFSNKGPFNTPVYIPDPTTMISIFGDIDRSLENKGSFFLYFRYAERKYRKLVVWVYYLSCNVEGNV